MAKSGQETENSRDAARQLRYAVQIRVLYLCVLVIFSVGIHIFQQYSTDDTVKGGVLYYLVPWFWLPYVLLVVATHKWWTPVLAYWAFRNYPRRIIGNANAYDSLLPFQQTSFVKQMDAILEQLPQERSLAIGMRGGWGSGKSTVLDAWASKAEHRHDIAVVWCNVWENDSEHDLHWILTQAIVAHPKVMLRAMDRYTLRLVFTRLINLPRLIPQGLRLRWTPAENAQVDGLVLPRPLRFQEALENVVQRATQVGYKDKDDRLRIVVVLDELDRARAETAQAAMILVRRALELPGMVVVLPYVEEQLLYKVFNPLSAVNIDLRETMLAILRASYMASGQLPDRGLLDEGRRWLLGEQGKRAEREAEAAQVLDGEGTRVGLKQALETGLLLYYAGLDRIQRQRVTKLFEEKFIALSLSPGRLGYKDLPSFAVRGRAIGPLWKDCSLWKDSWKGADTGSVEHGRCPLSDRVDDMRLKLGLPEKIDNLRLVEGFMIELLDEVCSAPELRTWLHAAQDERNRESRLQLLQALILLVAGSRTNATLSVVTAMHEMT